MSDDIEKWAAKRLDELIDLHFGPSQQGKDRAVEWDAALDRAEAAEGRLDVVREWLDSRGVDVGERDDDYMRGYRDAQRHALQDAAALRAAIEDAR